MAKKLVIFDFDGVLVDTMLMCLEINKVTNPYISYKDYQAMSNGNFHDAAQSGIKDNTFTPHPEFHSLYDEKLCDINIPLILKEAVIKLAKDNFLSIVSSGDTTAIKNHIKREGLAGCFDQVLGYDFHTSKTFKLKKLLADHKVSPKDAVFVTDTLGDILEANEAGIPSIAVSWGLHEKETFLEGNPAAIIDDPKDLIPTIKRILG
jgi:phosphoglycolate phosphatase